MKPSVIALSALAASTLPPGYWTPDQARAVLDKTQEIRLAPDLGALTMGERKALDRLLEVGAIFQRLYEESRHHQARESLAALEALHKAGTAAAHTDALLRLYRLNQGPIATTLDNKRLPFLPVAPPEPGKNVYPVGVTKEEIEAFLARNPVELARLLHARTVMRRATAENLGRDLATLARHPVVDTLHPGLSRRLAMTPSASAFYAVPYAVAYADDLVKAFRLVMEAADAVAADDAELAGYLRNRARDLLTRSEEH